MSEARSRVRSWAGAPKHLQDLPAPFDQRLLTRAISSFQLFQVVLNVQHGGSHARHDPRQRIVDLM